MKDEQVGGVMTKYISREQESELAIIKQFYNLLKSKLTGQVINGVLIGCLTRTELEEAYCEFKEKE